MKSSTLKLSLMLTAATMCSAAWAQTYDINTLAGKVASVNGTAGLQIRFSAFIEEESVEASAPAAPGPITPVHVLSSPLDGTSILAPAVTVNQDTAGAPQNETSIAVDPNNPNRVVAGLNDYVTRAWSCFIGGTPCSALGDGYSGAYFSNDGGSTWCCVSTDPSHLGTLIPGVNHLTGGIYDAGGDPAVAFDGRGHVYYAGLGFNRTAPGSTVTVNRGTFDSSGKLTWSAPTFINQTTSPSILNDKEWIAVDSHPGSAFRDRIYVTWTRFIFNPQNGRYVQSPIAVAYSKDGGATFSDPQLIVGNVLYGQGSRPTVGPDGTVYVFWDGSTRQQSLDSIYMVKSTDGGATWSKPVAVSQLVDIIPVANTAFRVNSFPAAAVAPDGTLYVTWASLMSDAPAGGLCPAQTNSGCHSTVLYSRSTNGGATWSAPVAAFPTLDAASPTPEGYPVTQPSGGTLTAPAPRRVDTLFPAISSSSSGRVFISAYAADVVSPWQVCAAGPAPPIGRITCDTLGDYIHNARLDYVVRDLTTNVTNTVSTHPINTRNGFGGGFFGDYTDVAAGSDNTFHALWTDSNNKQSVVWFYGAQFVPTLINQEDIATASGSF
jgi:hypothetical protein